MNYSVKDNFDPDLEHLKLSWCFGLNVTASLLGMAATVLFFVEFVRMLDIRENHKSRANRQRQAEANGLGFINQYNAHSSVNSRRRRQRHGEDKDTSEARNVAEEAGTST